MSAKKIAKRIKSLYGIKKKNSLCTGSMERSRSQKGFTLIEIVVTLVIVGILAVLGGMGIVQAVKGYVTVKQNSATTQKAQMAMSRISREIVEMVTVSSAATNTNLPLSTVTNCSSNCYRTIGLDNGAIKMAFGSSSNPAVANGDILMDNVSSLTFTYWQGSNSQTTWPKGQDNLLSAVDVDMHLSSPNVTFTTRIAPRNNGNLGGETPPSSATSAAPSGWGCFVATAAYGDPAHPMVQILREFRDRHLIHWPGGQWIVKQYYKHGPAAADMIRNRPMAMFTVRCLLAPFAAFVFCLMYAPAGIPFIFIISLFIVLAMSSLMKRKFPNRFGASSSRGSILISLIITMVIMAVLAAAMLPMFSASYMNQVYADQGRKAYFLAESGFRYVAFNYRNATTDSAKDTVLGTLNNRTCNLLDNLGSFTTVVYPLWFNTSANTSSGATTLSTVVPGTIPSEFSGSSFAGYMQVRSYSSSSSTIIGYYSYSSFSVTGANVVFSGIAASAPTTAVFPATTYPVVVLPVAKTTQTTLTKGGTLTLSATGVSALPAMNGSFTLINSSTGAQINFNSVATVFNYTSRSGNVLYNVTITDPTQNTNWTSSLALASTTNVVLQKFLRLTSTGATGSASRTVTYNVPVGWISGAGSFQKQQYLDPMTSGTNWYTAANVTLGTQTFDSSGAMQVTSMVDPSSSSILSWLAGLLGWKCGNAWNFIEWNWSNTNTNLAQAWMDSLGFLNYDLQVKVKNSSAYLFTGMNFRGRSNSDDSDFYTYGVSFIKPRASSACAWLFGWICATWYLTSDECPDLIPGGQPDSTTGEGTLFPGGYGSLESTGTTSYGTGYEYGLPAIVLWKRDSSDKFKWLAYRTLTAADGIVTYNSSTKAYRLVDSSTLMVRVSEGYSLTFTAGNTGTPIKEGDYISNSSGQSARVVMTPILTSGSWTSASPAAGTLVIANVWNTTSKSVGSFSSGDSLYVSGTKLATAGTYTATKKNYIRVYFTGTSTLGTANAVETDNNRLNNPVGTANWPPDPLTDLSASTDFVTLVQWTATNGLTASSTPAAIMTSTSEPTAIIATTDLVSPTWTISSTAASFVGPDGTSAGDNIGLITGYNSGTSTYYDDFAAQLDLKSGTGFLTSMQQ